MVQSDPKLYLDEKSMSLEAILELLLMKQVDSMAEVLY